MYVSVPDNVHLVLYDWYSPWAGDIHKMQGWTRLLPHLLAPYHTSALPYTYLMGPPMAYT